MPHKTIMCLSGVARYPANGFPARLLGLEVNTNDPKAKNPARICFLGYDPDIGIADSAALLAMHVDLKSKAPPAKERRRTRARAATPPAGPNEESVEGDVRRPPQVHGAFARGVAGGLPLAAGTGNPAGGEVPRVRGRRQVPREFGAALPLPLGNATSSAGLDGPGMQPSVPGTGPGISPNPAGAPGSVPLMRTACVWSGDMRTSCCWSTRKRRASSTCGWTMGTASGGTTRPG